ncbi:MAG: hypothetical protein IJR69_06705 [Bacteroidaceae bacterium]|nr:hypothetical protein [Bacteroidaceae bacterium]
MTKKVLVKGNDRVVDNIKQENRVRVKKGQVTITPADNNVENVTVEQFETLQGQVEALAAQVEALTAQLAGQGSGEGGNDNGGDNTETPGEGD